MAPPRGKHPAYNAKWLADRKQRGLCRNCKAKVCATSTAFCLQHLLDNRERQRVHKEKVRSSAMGRPRKQSFWDDCASSG